jgi:hypothetical protein
MAKYDALADHLADLGTDRVTLSFDEIDAVVGGLPPNAKADRTWWGNTTNRTRVQAHAWMGVGWRVERVSLTRKEVVFERKYHVGTVGELHG